MEMYLPEGPVQAKPYEKNGLGMSFFSTETYRVYEIK